MPGRRDHGEFGVGDELDGLNGVLKADNVVISEKDENYKKVAPDPNYWPKFLTSLEAIQWEGFSNEELASIFSLKLDVPGISGRRVVKVRCLRV